MNKAASRKRTLFQRTSTSAETPDSSANRASCRAERQRDQRRAGLDHGQAEPAGRIVGKSGRAKLRDRRAPGGEHKRRRLVLSAVDGHAEPAVGMVDRTGRMPQGESDARCLALLHQHGDDLPRRTVAEQLAERLLVPGDAVAFDQRDEIGRRVAAQCRLGEMRVGRKKALGGGVEVGEVAPAAARYQDLAARRIAVIDQQHAPSPRAGGHRAHHAGGAGAQHDCVPDRAGGHAETMLLATASATLIPSMAAERMPPA